MAHRQSHQVNNLHGLDYQQLGTQNLVGLRVNHELHDAARVLLGLRTRHRGNRGNRLRSDLHLVASLDCLTLGQAHGRQRRVHVNGRSHCLTVLGGAGTVTDQLGEHHAVVIHGDVGELRAAVHVTERENVRHGAAQVLIHDNCAAVVGFDAGVLQAQTLGGGLAAGRNHHVVHLQLPGSTLGVEVGHGHRVSAVLEGLHAHAGMSGNVLVCDNLAGNLGNVLVVAAEEGGCTVQNGHLGTVGGENTGELNTDGAATDNAQALGARGELLQLGGGEHTLRFADTLNRRDNRHGTGVDDEVVGGNAQGVLARGDLNLGVGDETCVTVNELSGLVGQQDLAVLGAHHAGQLVTENHGGFVGGVCLFKGALAAGAELIGAVHERLGGYTTDVDAGAAVHAGGLFDEGNVLAGLGVCAGEGLAALAEANDDHVKVQLSGGGHNILL